MKTYSPKTFTDSDAALDYAAEIYAAQVAYLQEKFAEYAEGKTRLSGPVHGFYPEVRLTVKKSAKPDARLSYGYLPRLGHYGTSLTGLKLFRDYYKQQLDVLMQNHKEPLEISLGETPIPLHFALGGAMHLEHDLTSEQIARLPDFFDLPDIRHIDDDIVNMTYEQGEEGMKPLALFTAPRVDMSLQRIRHYTGTDPKHFQKFILFTNYPFYIDQFVDFARDAVADEKSGYDSIVMPTGRVLTASDLNKTAELALQPEREIPEIRAPQMPAYHLTRKDGRGVTIVNIGVGPSNAKTMTDHLAVLRPHAWLMVGHCAGLRNNQQLGDYVLAHGYLRDDHILDEDLPTDIPIPPLAEVQVALQDAVAEMAGMDGYEVKRLMRTGTVATVDDRNWELRENTRILRKLSLARAIALDMESATIAANGLRYRVPYGTLLCVSDRPLHGELKLPGMANTFYRERVEQHLRISIRAMELLRDIPPARLHSRKLRSFSEVAFR